MEEEKQKSSNTKQGAHEYYAKTPTTSMGSMVTKVDKVIRPTQTIKVN